MAFDIQWGLLGGGTNIAEAATRGYATGQAAAQQNAQRSALAAYAAAPTQNALGGILAAGDVQSYSALSKVEAERAELARAAKARTIGADYLRGQGGRPADGLAPSMAQGGISPPPPSGITSSPLDGEEVVVQGRAPRRTPSAADVFEASPEMLEAVTKHMGSMQKVEHDAYAQKTAVGAAVALAASKVPLAERQAFIDSNRPLLLEGGFTQQEVDGFEPTDENLRGLIAVGVGADKYLADQRQEKGQQIAVRGQDVSAATSRRGQDIGAATARSGQAITARGQDIGAATARAGQAVAMRGQDMTAANRAAPKPATVALARGKLNSLKALGGQLDRVEKALARAKYVGPVAGRLPGGLSGADDAADKAIAGLAPLLRQLTRVPGEGAMSDYESRLANAGLPSRANTREGRQEAISQIRALVDQSRAGYEDIVGAPAASGKRTFKVIR